MIRAFVGVPVPPEVARELEAAQAGLPAGRAVAPENFHLTLAFVGEHRGTVIEDVHHALEPIRSPGFELVVDGLGTFGGEIPRILFANVIAEPALSALRKKVRRAVREAGIELPHERHQPHITLARMGRELNGEDALALQGFVARRIGRVRATFPVTEFCLYESKLGRSGPVYSVLAEYPLES